MDPGAWAEHLGTVLAGMMMARKNPEPEEEEPETPLHTLRQWFHPSVTVALVVFMFTQYDQWREIRTGMEKNIVTLQQQIVALQETNIAQDRLELSRIEGLTKRVDFHRDQITDMQREINAHIARDDARFTRRTQ